MCIRDSPYSEFLLRWHFLLSSIFYEPTATQFFETSQEFPKPSGLKTNWVNFSEIYFKGAHQVRVFLPSEKKTSGLLSLLSLDSVHIFCSLRLRVVNILSLSPFSPLAKRRAKKNPLSHLTEAADKYSRKVNLSLFLSSFTLTILLALVQLRKISGNYFLLF